MIFDDGDGGAMDEQLMARRTIMVSGPLDHTAVSLLSARLMTLDRLSAQPIDLVVNSPGGPLPEIFAALDVIDLMRAPVNVTGVGQVGGTAVALVAVCTGERRSGPRTAFSLQSGETLSIEGRPDDIVRQADEVADIRTRYLERLSRATGRETAALAQQLERGPRLTPTEAMELGIIDAVADRRSSDGGS